MNELHTVDLEYKGRQDIQHFTPLTDLHIDAAGFDDAAFSRLCKERNQLPNHRWGIFGDLGNLIHSNDPRFVPGCTKKEFIVDSLHSKMVGHLAVFLADHGIKPDIIGIGNHESAWTKRRGSNLCEDLCRALPDNPAYGGIEGFLQYRMRRPNGDGRIDMTFLYHHGAWGGRLAKGRLGAQHYAMRHRGWDVFLYGHSHGLHIDTDGITEPYTKTGALVTKKVYLVCCGTHQGRPDPQPYTLPSYAAIKGYPRSVVGAPLIKWSVVPRGPKKRELVVKAEI